MKSSQQVRRPLVGVAFILVLGLLVQQCFHLPVLLLLGLSACALALVAGSEKFCRSGGSYVALLLLASAYGAVESLPVSVQTVLSVSEVVSAQQEITGTIVDDPKTFDDDTSTVFRFQVDAVRFYDGWRAADSTIRVYCDHMPVPAVYGERWRLTGRFRGYEKKYGGRSGSFYTDSNRAIRLGKAPKSFRSICYQTRRHAASVLQQGMKDFPEKVQLLLALLLGYRHELPDDLYETFSKTGTLHIFAISGLHVGVMAAILIAFLKVLGVSKQNWGWVLIPLLFFYVVSTGMKPSAFRAFTMASAYFAAPLVHRRPDTVSAVALAAIILLAVNPFQLSDPGFLLSFTVVCGIIMVHTDAVHRFRGRINPGRIIWARLNGPHPISVFLRTVGMLMLTSVAAWLFSAPMTAAFFNTLSPAALVGNLAIIPLTFMIVLTGCFSLLAALVLPVASVMFNHANRIFIHLLMRVIQLLGEVPGAYHFVRTPSVWVPLLWYTGLVLVFAVRMRWRRIGVFFVCCAVVMWVFESHSFRHLDRMDVKRDIGGAVMVADGSSVRALVAEGDSYSLYRAHRFLKKTGVNQLSVLAIADTKMDTNAVWNICEEFSVEQLWLPSQINFGVPKEICAGIQVVFADYLSMTVGSGEIRMKLQ